MPDIVADNQSDDIGCQRAQNIPEDAAKIDGILQFLADFSKSLPFLFQSVLRLIPFSSGGLQVFLNAFGRVIGINQPVADEQRIPFHSFRMLKNDGLQFVVLREQVGVTQGRPEFKFAGTSAGTHLWKSSKPLQFQLVRFAGEGRKRAPLGTNDKELCHILQVIQAVCVTIRTPGFHLVC
jgi:hypothetical protein